MNSRRCGVIAAAAIMAALTFPRSEAQTSGDAQITILQTTDLHHHANGADHVGFDADPVTATSVTGAYARIAAYVNSVRANAGHPVLLVDSGDWTMGTLYDLTLGKQPLALYFFDLMKYDSVTLGNHEFDYAPAGLAQILGTAKSAFGFHTPIVASNMNLGGSTDLAPFVGDGKAIQTTRVQDLANGIRVGYIGLMGESAASSAPVTAPVSFPALSTHYAAIQALVDGLRTTQGANVVIALSHSGTDPSGNNGEDVELARHVTGIDVIASGHTHTPLYGLHTVNNAGWNTQIIDAGAYGSSVARIDLTYHASSKATTVTAFSNLPMTSSQLNNISASLAPDPAIAAIVSTTDQQLNAALGPFLAQTFADYSAGNLSKGIYHSVGSTAQDMVPNLLDRVVSPNGLGDLAADAVRSVPNGIIAQTLTAVGGNPAKLPAYDFTPFQLGVVATGVVRGTLQAGVPLTLADIYNVLPLGISPDSSQSIPVGFPLISTYLELADVKKVCALQLLAQSNLIPADYYLNLSGIRYSLKATESNTYFKYAAGAAALQVISQKVASSPAALQALLAILSLSTDNGAALLAAYASDNPYAGALVKLNDATPTPAQIGANLAVVGQVAAAAAADLAAGTTTLNGLVVSKAVAAIDTVSGFAPTDSNNTGPVTDLPGTARVRVVADLYAILVLGGLQSQFGVAITAYKSASGPTTLSGADLNGILANRVNAAPLGAGVQELKEWMALLYYLQTGLGGSISSAYASTPDFTQFGTDGAAVQMRNASYPIASIGQLVSTLGGLQGTPLCTSSAPAVTAVTNGSYGQAISGTGAMIVWGSGFFPGGGNAVLLNRVGGTESISFDAGTGQYFWDLAPNQVNTALSGRVAAGQWMVSVRNACGAISAGFPVTIQ